MFKNIIDIDHKEWRAWNRAWGAQISTADEFDIVFEAYYKVSVWKKWYNNFLLDQVQFAGSLTCLQEFYNHSYQMPF